MIPIAATVSRPPMDDTPNMNAEKLGHISQTQRERIFYIDFRLCFLGTLTRQDLVARFGIKEAAATRDLSLYRELAPNNMAYDAAAKQYLSNEGFEPVFRYTSEKVLLALTQGIGDDFIGTHKALVSSEIPLELSRPDLRVLSVLSSAIHQSRPAEIQYYSTSSGHTSRTIVPFSLVNNGLRWHVRAYDRRRNNFLDFVLTRVSDATLLSGEISDHESRDADIQWNRIVDLELVPHPNLSHPESIALDYHMTDNRLRIQVRAAVAGYLLRRWNVDCTPDHSLEGNEYQLWLSNRPTLYGVENLALAPGYEEEDAH